MNLKKNYNIKTIKINHSCGCTMYIKIKEEFPITDILKQCSDIFKTILEQNHFHCIGCGRRIVVSGKVLKILMIKE